MSEVNITDIREAVRNLVDGERVTFARMAREIGLSTSVVSGFMNNKYAGDNYHAVSAATIQGCIIYWR
ncbi:hypothetical protein ACU4ZE_000599 [Serratia marcescens]